MPWVAPIKLKVNPIAEARILNAISPWLTSQPPYPYRPSKEKCTAPLLRDSRFPLAFPNWKPHTWACPTNSPNLSLSNDSPANDLQNQVNSGCTDRSLKFSLFSVCIMNFCRLCSKPSNAHQHRVNGSQLQDLNEDTRNLGILLCCCHPEWHICKNEKRAVCVQDFDKW